MSPASPSKSPPPASSGGSGRGRRPPLSPHESQDPLILLSSSIAPTPNNTISPADTFASRPWRASRGHSEATSVITEGEEVMNAGHADVAHGHSQVSPVSTRDRHPTSTIASHGTSRLLPWGTTTIAESTAEPIPFSSVPIPAPPKALSPKKAFFDHPDDVKSLGTSPPETPSVLVGPVSFADGDRDVMSPDVESSSTAWSSRWKPKKRKRKLTQADVDAQRLQQLGYDPVLGRVYTFWSSLSLSTLNIGAIQGTVYAVAGAYQYGGPRMIAIMWPISGIFSICLVLTLAELASAYPVAGAMASWAWKAARGGVGRERGWAWLMGGVVIGGHIASALFVTLEAAQVIQHTMELSLDYEAQLWQQVLFFLAVLAVCGIVGSQRWGRSHYFWCGAGIYTLCVWLVLCISLLATGATKHAGNAISGDFINSTGWSAKSYVYILGWSLCTIAAGADAAAHMAEETQNPSRNVPNAMVGSMVITYVCGYISIILLLVSIPVQDAGAIINSEFAVGYILTQAINTKGAIVICCLIIVTMTLQVLAQLQASSRFVFALARDHAMPFSNQIQRTNNAKMPIVAHWLVIALCLPFCVLPYGNNTLFGVLATGAGSLSYLGYVTPAALYLFNSKLNLQQEGRTSWSLRSFSRPIAAIGVTFGLIFIICIMLPSGYPVNVADISFAPVTVVGTAVTCFITWKLYGSRHYSGPIRALTKWETGVEIDLQTTLNSGRSRNTEQDGSNYTPHINDTTGLGVPQHVKGHIGGDDGVVHTVTVQSARSLDEEYEGGEWTTASSSGGAVDLERAEEIRPASTKR